VSWRRLTGNLGWKVASLLLALVLWFAVEGQPQLATVQAVPVLYRNVPQGLALAADAPANVRAELRGTPQKLAPSSLAEVFVALDLESAGGPGEHSIYLSSADFRLPEGVQFVRSMPPALTVKLTSEGKGKNP
jgi:hypothetical protein